MTAIRGRRVITPEGERAATVLLRDGVIAGLAGYTGAPDGAITLAGDEVLLPGLVDSHVHVNEPGRTEWEGFATATAAAAAGGVTTIVDMPLNSIPPTVTVPALRAKQAAAAGQLATDVAFWGGAVPGNVASLRPLHEAGVVGFKCFLLPSGVDEFAPLNAAQLGEAMTEIASFGGLLIAHAEDPEVIAAAPAARGRRYADFLASRPPEAEQRAITALLAQTRRTGCRTHIVHLASAAALPAVRRGQGGRPAGQRRDVPALPDPARRGHPGRRHRVQVLPADPGRRQPRGAVGRAAGWHDRLRRVRPFTVPGGGQADGHR